VFASTFLYELNSQFIDNRIKKLAKMAGVANFVIELLLTISKKINECKYVRCVMKMNSLFMYER
jgi:S-adenosylmethionine synthetase